MFSGFQSNAFQSPGFQIMRSGEPPTPETGGGGAGGDLSRYRDHLKSIADAADRRLYKQVKRHVEEIVENENLPVEVIEAAEEITYSINFDEIAQQESLKLHNLLLQLLIKLDKLLEQAMLQEQEEELIILMAIS